jgi:chromosome partitioning protein
MKRVIAFANHKGGVGKTTSAVNIASVLGEMGKRVLVIDIDPQGSASLHFGVRDKGTGFLHAMERTVAAPVLQTAVRGVDLVPSGPALSEAAQRFSGVVGAELLARCLARTQGDWELVIIDCPPGPGILTSSALRVSQHVVIPVETTRLALNGLDQLIETLDSMRREKPHPGILGLIACRANPRRRIHRETMADLERRFPGRMAPFVRENVALAEAPAQGKPVTLYAPGSIGAEDYRRVTQWLLERWD